MSELTKKDSDASKEKTHDADQSQDSNMLPENWEARLAAARAQREKVLEAKGKSVSKSKSARPWLMEEDTNADLRTPLPMPMEDEEELMAEMLPNANVPDNASETARVNAALRETTQIPANQRFGSFSRISVVAFACFFGLGFGMVLSFGAITAMGWISWKNVGSTQALAALNSEAPQISTTMAASIIPAAPGNTDPQYSHTALTPVVTQMQAKPTLVAAAVADQALAPIQSPALRLDTSGIANELVSQFNFQPANIAMTFANPTRPAVTQALLEVGLASNDEIPTLLEEGRIKTPVILASLTPPLVDLTAPLASGGDDAMYVRMPVPTLFSSEPGNIISVAWSQPEKISVFETAVPDGFSNAPVEDAVLPNILPPDAPPARVSLSKAPTLESNAIQLPFFEGPSNFKPSLAFTLGLNTDAVKTYTLVTFAPENVSDDRVANTAELLGGTGFPVAKINRVNFKVSKTHIRYYNTQDEKVARAIAEKVGGTVRNFTTARNSPPPGRVEIWLEGNKKQNLTASKPKRTVSTAQRRAAFKSRLEQRLVNSLRRGEHLK